MKRLFVVPAVLLFLGCEPYPADAQTVAMNFCQATKALDFKQMTRYANEAYARKLKEQGKGYEAALKIKLQTALDLQETYRNISCEDLTVVEIPGRMMAIQSSSEMLNGIKLKEENREWKIIE